MCLSAASRSARGIPELAFQNEHLGEFAALFAIRRMLEGQAPTSMFGICHYRRFALTQPLGEMRGFNSYAHPSLLSQARPEHFFGEGNKIIVPSLVHFEGSVLRQYAAVAEARDLMMYFGAAVDAGAVDQNAAADFLSQNSFIPACTAAYLPVGWFVDIVTRVEMATQSIHEDRAHRARRPAEAQRRLLRRALPLDAAATIHQPVWLGQGDSPRL